MFHISHGFLTSPSFRAFLSLLLFFLSHDSLKFGFSVVSTYCIYYHFFIGHITAKLRKSKLRQVRQSFPQNKFAQKVC